jgi:hypothetical protein
LNIFQEELDVKDFMARRVSQVDDEILSDRDGSENQMISDIPVKSFLTSGWGDDGGGVPRDVWGRYLVFAGIGPCRQRRDAGATGLVAAWFRLSR